jgi:hypothetical protein
MVIDERLLDSVGAYGRSSHIPGIGNVLILAWNVPRYPPRARLQRVDFQVFGCHQLDPGRI